MLSFLLDENISPEVAHRILQKRPDLPVLSIHSWQGAQFKVKRDEVILTEAALENLTLVTYDQRTIMSLLVQWGQAGKDHAGVIFVDERTIAPSNFGALVRSLIAIWEKSKDEDWSDSVLYLKS